MYEIVLRRLYQENVLKPVKMGLNNIEVLYNVLGRPLDNVHIIHVAGTNGKGSVSWKTAEYLKRGGLKTGLFVSPHISSFRERVQVNGVILSEEDVTTYLPQIFKICETHDVPATFFELTTALAFLKFKQEKCDAVVLEVGLGGRLDATNVITPSVSVITSIQLDHTKILGDTIEQIAMEKAGIMKPTIPVLVGPGCPIDLLRQEAYRVKSPFYCLHDILSSHERKYNPSASTSTTDIDDLNKDIAHAAIKILLKNNNNIFKNNEKFFISAYDEQQALYARPPCRFEIIKYKLNTTTCSNNSDNVEVEVVLDIAHNVDSLEALVSKMKKEYSGRKMRIVLGISADKDVDKCLDVILTKLTTPDRIHCVEASHPRALSAPSLRSMLLNHSSTQNTTTKTTTTTSTATATNTTTNDILDVEVEVESGDVREGVRSALLVAAEENPPAVVLICGTFFIMAEARAELGIVEAKDGDILYAENVPGAKRDIQEIILP
eukprot:gene7249-14785_t